MIASARSAGACAACRRAANAGLLPGKRVVYNGRARPETMERTKSVVLCGCSLCLCASVVDVGSIPAQEN